MLVGMESPEHERRAIESYIKSQSGAKLKVRHVEKLTTEFVLGHQYDVWDAHTNEGRWWVITNPTNLYSQKLIRSMDIALSFHIGLMQRMMARDDRQFNNRDGNGRWILEVLRRLGVANEALDRAKEVEDIQAVGMRLREALLALIDRLRALDLPMPDEEELPAQLANFKAWSALYADVLAPGSSMDRLRALLKAQAERTWEYVNWLTHARNANHIDGRIACAATSQTIETYLFATTRRRSGSPERCPLCASYQLASELTDDSQWLVRCNTCGWSEAAAEPPGTEVASTELIAAEPVDSAPDGECVVPKNFGIYLSPAQARSVLDEAAERALREESQPSWTNPFAFRFGEDYAPIQDAHRVAYASFTHRLAHGSELTYLCAEDSCVNPDHAQERPLPGSNGWTPMIVEAVINRPFFLELEVSRAGGRMQRLFIDRATLSRYGFGDASSLVERVIMISAPGKNGWVEFLPVARRADHAHGTASGAWLHPRKQLDGDAACPCGSAIAYESCHGAVVEDDEPAPTE